jgi:hypothetical protein
MDIAIESAVHNSLQMNRARAGPPAPPRARDTNHDGVIAIEIEHLDL